MALAGLTVQAEAAQYFVSTDQQTYAPGDIITVTGKVPLPEPKISALSDGTAYAPNHYHVTVASTMNLAVPQNLGLADCQYFDFDNLPAGLYDAERNAGGPAQESGKYYRYYHVTPQDVSSEYVRAECGFASDGSFSFVINGTGQTDGKYKVGFRASQDILLADGSKLDSKDWSKSATFKIRTGATSEPDPKPTSEPDPPTIISAEITSPNKVTIKFSEKVNAPKSAFSDFTVTGEDKSRKILDRIATTSKTITLTIGGKAMSLDATGTIDVSGKVKSKAGVKLIPLDDHPVTDGQADQTALEPGLVENLQSMIAKLEEKVRDLTERITNMTAWNRELAAKNTELAAETDNLKKQMSELQQSPGPTEKRDLSGIRYIKVTSTNNVPGGIVEFEGQLFDNDVIHTLRHSDRSVVLVHEVGKDEIKFCAINHGHAVGCTSSIADSIETSTCVRDTGSGTPWPCDFSESPFSITINNDSSFTGSFTIPDDWERCTSCQFYGDVKLKLSHHVLWTGSHWDYNKGSSDSFYIDFN